MNKKILHLNFSDDGGAAIAVMRIHDALKQKNYESKILVAEKNNNFNDVFCDQNNFHKFIWKQKKKISRNLKFIFKSKNKGTHTISFFGSNILSQINRYNPDLINIHWIGNEFISLKQISQINRPIIWTLHDMWLYTGAEHYATDERFIHGYNKDNRNIEESGLDINRWVWNRKKKYLSKNIKIISPSSWQYQNAKKSFLLKDLDIHKIPLPIDTGIWKPINKINSRNALGWSNHKIYFLFCIIDYSRRNIKGLDIALDLFDKFNKVNNGNCVLNIFGKIDKKYLNKKNVNILGNINTQNELRKVYSASNLLLNPSRLESFGQVALEALACGLPILINKNTGTNDLILCDEMGYTLENEINSNFSPLLKWFHKHCLNNNQDFIHNKIKENFSYPQMANQYKELIDKIS
jgi:glycosyltransferase involved in cell wall biosynthesis